MGTAAAAESAVLSIAANGCWLVGLLALLAIAIYVRLVVSRWGTLLACLPALNRRQFGVFTSVCFCVFVSIYDSFVILYSIFFYSLFTFPVMIEIVTLMEPSNAWTDYC